MAARRLLLAALLLFVAVAPAVVRAQDEPQVPNAKFNFMGETTGSVFVRSGPSENYYPTAKLDKGTRVKVVGMKYQWLKIEPPADSFSYVGKAFVDRHGDGKAGRVNNPANVRAGSALNQMKTTIQTKLDPGAEVKIQGEEDEYYKIEPPAGAYLYINQQYVRPVGPADDQGIAQGSPAQPAAPVASDTNAGGTPATDPRAAEVESTARRTTDAIIDAATNPNPAAGASEPGVPSTTAPAAPQPSVADAKFEQLEADFATASQKSVIEQPIGELLARYHEVAQEPALPESLKRVADARLAALKVRQEAREQFLATRKAQDEMRQRSQALLAEREELQERLKETQVDFYTAVGTLRPSSLQSGPSGTVLYRLTDPQTGRTLVYVRAADRAQVAPLLNQFVGVRGELRKDPLLRLNVIQPTETVAVDQDRLGNGIAAAVMPPSLLPRLNTASTAASDSTIEGQ